MMTLSDNPLVPAAANAGREVRTFVGDSGLDAVAVGVVEVIKLDMLML